jgi:hypothetical protein
MLILIEEITVVEILEGNGFVLISEETIIVITIVEW